MNNEITLETSYGYNFENSQWDVHSKEEYEYNTNGDRFKEAYYYWDTETKQWTGYKFEYTLNENGTPTQKVISEWINNNWVENDKYVMTLNSEGHPILREGFRWNSQDSEWRLIRKTEYTIELFADYSNLLAIESRLSEGNWINYEKEISKRNNEGIITDFEYYNWNEVDAKWEGDEAYKHEFDENGNNVLDINYSWDNTTDTWYEYSKSVYVFNTLNQETEKTTFNYDIDIKELLPSEKMETNYDASNREEEIIVSSWDSDLQALAYDWKEQYTYDENGNITQEITYYYDGSNWVNSSKKETAFNQDVTISQIYMADNYEDNFWKNMALSESEYTWDGSVWRLFTITTFYYSELLSTGVRNAELNKQAKLYPNPAINIVYIEIPEFEGSAIVEIVDMQGKTQISSTLNNSNSLDVSTIKPGVYIFRITTAETTFSGKLIKK